MRQALNIPFRITKTEPGPTDHNLEEKLIKWRNISDIPTKVIFPSTSQNLVIFSHLHEIAKLEKVECFPPGEV